ncbi:uncharacterized protein LOC6558729 [Drosophila grimshawi]|uniref:uncharacterized protein LOC6558729 n=1 Tax=Drosophila grimshawi TaxID=7222 RepID=UPI000C87052C|nr:uncharacterized protein LOC6558729 [Drosophila grimshawi]
MPLMLDYYAVLKPVNEYNIVDKIKEANKQLFALDDEQNEGDGDGVEASDNPNGSNRKVTFALNLEDYEPTAQQLNMEQRREEEEPLTPPEELLLQLAQLKLKPIAEEPAKEQQKAEEEPMEVLSKELVMEEEEDICEEILDLSEMENRKELQPAIEAATLPASMDYEDDDFSGVDEDDLTAASETMATATQQRRIARQNTFDLNSEQLEGESDQRSLTNLLTESDCEEDERAVNEARLKLRQAYKSLYKTLDANGQAQINRLTATDSQNGQDEAEEDDLSIIVASYIPDDFELDERSIYYKKDVAEEQKQRTSPNGNNNNNSTGSSNCTSTKTFFNARRFSFRRRARSTPSAPVQSVPEIKMNYKICCEHRHALQDKLPRYTGYMSEYGLSARQLQQREQQLRRKHSYSMEQTLNRNEQEMRKMQDNERAFTTWLKNKMRYPINKTRNMFDATRRRASVAAATSPNPDQQQQHQQQHHHHRSSSRRRDSHEVHAYRHLLGSWNK